MYKTLLCLFILPFTINSQNILGKWRTIDDESGIAKSTVEIFVKNGKVFGKITDIYNEKDKNALCNTCEGETYNKPILGLIIIKDLSQDGLFYKNGTIFDPEVKKHIHVDYL